MNYHINMFKMSTAGWHTYLQFAYGSLSQICQWLSPVTQTKLTKMHFKTRELVLACVAAFVKTPAFPPNLIIQWIEVVWIWATHH